MSWGFNGILLIILFGILLGGCINEETPTTTQPPLTTLPPETAAPHFPETPQPTTPTPTTTTSPAPTTPTPVILPSNPAKYELTFESTWSSSTHPTDFPPNPHFSGLIGATHKPSIYLWKEGELSTPGIQNVAENGEKNPLDTEINVLIKNEDACTIISGGGIGPSPGSRTESFTITPECHLVSIVSMLAPSPDWFVGVYALDLVENGEWIENLVIDLYIYDAGTDSGKTYSSPDERTPNPEPIHLIESEPFLVDGEVPPLGTFTFKLSSE